MKTGNNDEAGQIGNNDDVVNLGVIKYYNSVYAMRADRASRETMHSLEHASRHCYLNDITDNIMNGNMLKDNEVSYTQGILRYRFKNVDGL